MLLIDNRLFPLFETLAASNLDWLVRDILAVVEMGARQLEPEDAVHAAQERVRLKNDARSEGEDQTKTIASGPWTGDQQVALAADLVVRRIEDALVMARDSINGVSTLIGEATTADTDHSVEGVILLEENGELEASIDRSAIEHALGGLDQLRLAVEEWKSGMLDGTKTL